MDLSQKDRLMLSIQLRILELLDPGDAPDHRLLRKAIEEGYTVEYEPIADNILRTAVSTMTCNLVREVLDMYRAMKFSPEVDQLSADMAEQLDFPGFDGNNESEFLSYARYLVGDRKLYEESSPILNSHSPTVEIYQRMLGVWRDSDDPYQLTRADIERIIAARTHPDHRA